MKLFHGFFGKNRILLIALFVAAITLFTGCSSANLAEMPVKERFDIANNFFDKGKFRKAITYYETIVFDKNSAYTATAQYKLAMCYFNRKNYLDARFEFEQLIKQFPENNKVADAHFYIGQCYYYESPKSHYTQDETLQAIEAFNVFLDKFPGDLRRVEALNFIKLCEEKLAEKKYYNGYLYYRIKDYSSSLMYLGEVIESDYKNEFDRKARYYCAKIWLKRKEPEKAEPYYKTMQLKYPDSKETKRLAKAFKKK